MRQRVAVPPIILAAERGDANGVRAILKSQPDQLHATSRIGDSAIHAAAAQDQLQVVKILLEHGGSVNKKGNHGKTPLHYAAEAGSIAMVRLLLEKRANLKARDDQGRTPFDTASAHLMPSHPNTKRMFQLFAKFGEQLDIRSAVRQNNVGRVRYLLDADPTVLNKLPEEPGLIYEAVLRQVDPEIIKMLLNHGADPNAPLSARSRDFPLTRVSDPFVAELLICHGANVNQRNFQGMTPLERARKYKLNQLAEVLRQHGARMPRKRASKAAKENDERESAKTRRAARAPGNEQRRQRSVVAPKPERSASAVPVEAKRYNDG